jgi:TolA-binding protein
MPKEIKKLSERKSLTDREIQNTLTDFRERLKRRQKILALSLIAFFVIAATVAGLFLYNRSLTHKAMQLESEGQKLFYGLSQQKAPTADNRYKSALEKFMESYNTKKNPRVLYYMANCHYEMGDYEEAIKILNDLVNQFSDPQIVSLAHYKKAMAFLKKNDTENALNSLRLIVNLKDGIFQDLALLESGKILEATGRGEEAKGFYRQIIEKYPQSVFVSEAKRKVGEN